MIMTEGTALRNFAAWIRDTYPEDVFTVVDAAIVTKVHAAFDQAGLSVDQWSAQLIRHAADLAEYRAAQIDGSEES